MINQIIKNHIQMLKINSKTFSFKQIQNSSVNSITPLQEQLNRLRLTIDLIPLQKVFVIGYTFKDLNPVTPQHSKNLIRVIDILFDIRQCQIIDQQIFLQLIVVLSHICSNLQKHRVKNIMDFYENAIGQIINDKQYLKNKYFVQQKDKSHIKNKNKSIINQSHIRNENEMMGLNKGKSQLGQCPICVTQIFHENISILACGHMIHKQCFLMYMKGQITDKKFPIKCPFQQCIRSIQTQDIEQYLPKQLTQKYFQFTLHNFVDKNAKNMSWCPTPGCSNAFQFDEYVSNYKCPKCSKDYCLKCKTQMHNGFTCEQNKQRMNLSEEDKKFMQFIKGSKYKQCPTCKFWVQKSHGCCHMTCRCGYQFCYNCGVQYGSCNCENDYAGYYGSDDDGDNDADSRIGSQGNRSYGDSSELQLQVSVQSLFEQRMGIQQR